MRYSDTAAGTFIILYVTPAMSYRLFINIPRYYNNIKTIVYCLTGARIARALTQGIFRTDSGIMHKFTQKYLKERNLFTSLTNNLNTITHYGK